MQQRSVFLVVSILMLCAVGCGANAPSAKPVASKKPRGKNASRAAGHLKKANKSSAPSESRVAETEIASDTATEDAILSHPVVVLRTTQGEISLRLNRAQAPRTVDAFLHYVESGHYDGTIFHQVLDGQLVLGGGFTPQLQERQGDCTIPNEADNGLTNRMGTIAMARPLEAVNGATCQFFVNLTDNPQLDHQDTTADGYGYCVFGEVISGLDVLARISKLEVRSVDGFELLPVQTVLIESAAQMR